MKEKPSETQQCDGPDNIKQLQTFYTKLCGSIGKMNANMALILLTGQMGGQRLTIPTASALEREYRDVKIRLDYELGSSREALAKKFRLSKRHIDTILSSVSILDLKATD